MDLMMVLFVALKRRTSRLGTLGCEGAGRGCMGGGGGGCEERWLLVLLLLLLLLLLMLSAVAMGSDDCVELAAGGRVEVGVDCVAEPFDDAVVAGVEDAGAAAVALVAGCCVLAC